jgi:hypothetical protein
MGSEQKVLIDWCNQYSINYHTVKYRLERGMDLHTALTKSVQPKPANGFRVS